MDLLHIQETDTKHVERNLGIRLRLFIDPLRHFQKHTIQYAFHAQKSHVAAIQFGNRFPRQTGCVKSIFHGFFTDHRSKFAVHDESGHAVSFFRHSKQSEFSILSKRSKIGILWKLHFLKERFRVFLHNAVPYSGNDIIIFRNIYA